VINGSLKQLFCYLPRHLAVAIEGLKPTHEAMRISTASNCENRSDSVTVH
jgi:hypothetical protein